MVRLNRSNVLLTERRRAAHDPCQCSGVVSELIVIFSSTGNVTSAQSVVETNQSRHPRTLPLRLDDRIQQSPPLDFRVPSTVASEAPDPHVFETRWCHARRVPRG